ncbi:MAG TPA: DeoR family transcriptional regulator, partial [Verrucomicrobiae bacterium]|nr:DeoR family transcriptional regulator [Verrucomicrobiae bacterium]
MRGRDRKEKLLALIRQRGGVSLRDMAERFPVSKMTLHRDLEQLEQQGLIRRFFGGAVAVDAEDPKQAPQPAPQRAEEQQHASCAVCYRPASRQLYTLTLEEGGHSTTCCPQCGLSAHVRHKGKVAMAVTSDFLTGKPHPSHQSWFLISSDVATCCAPSVLSFEREVDARR